MSGSNPIGGPIDPNNISTSAPSRAREVSSSPVTGPSESVSEASPTTVRNVVRAVEKLFPGLSQNAKNLLANKTLGIDDDGPQGIANA